MRVWDQWDILKLFATSSLYSVFLDQAIFRTYIATVCKRVQMRFPHCTPPFSRKNPVQDSGNLEKRSEYNFFSSPFCAKDRTKSEINVLFFSVLLFLSGKECVSAQAWRSWVSWPCWGQGEPWPSGRKSFQNLRTTL